MLMRILIPFIILSCIVCCRTKELRIPDQPGLSHLASPVFLKSDTTWVDLKDYFLYPEKIKKITSVMGFFYNDDLQWSALYGILLIICIKRRFSRKTAFKCEVYSYEQEIFLQAISGRK